MIKIVKSWYDFAVVSGGVANHFAYIFLSGQIFVWHSPYKPCSLGHTIFNKIDITRRQRNENKFNFFVSSVIYKPEGLCDSRSHGLLDKTLGLLYPL